jgi:hypothetical protein
MHAHNSANADLVLEVLPNGEPRGLSLSAAPSWRHASG